MKKPVITKEEYKNYLKVKKSIEDKLYKILDSYTIDLNNQELLEDLKEYEAKAVFDTITSTSLSKIEFCGMDEICMPTKYIFDYDAWKKEHDKEIKAVEEQEKKRLENNQKEIEKCLDEYKGKERDALKILLDNDTYGGLRHNLLLAKKNAEK